MEPYIKILCPNRTPEHSALHRPDPKLKDSAKAEIEKMVAKNIIEPALSKLADSIMLVPKEDETLQYSVDFCKRNAAAKLDPYLIPCMNECIESRVEAIGFSIRDTDNGYCKIEIEDSDKNKTTFAAHHGLY